MNHTLYNDGLKSDSPFYNVDFIHFLLSMPGWCLRGDPKYLLRKIPYIPQNIISRPKISASPRPHMVALSKVASHLICDDLCMAELINVNLFRKLCQNIIMGKVENPNDIRFLNTLIGLEHFMRSEMPNVNIKL